MLVSSQRHVYYMRILLAGLLTPSPAGVLIDFRTEPPGSFQRLDYTCLEITADPTFYYHGVLPPPGSALPRSIFTGTLESAPVIGTFGLGVISSGAQEVLDRAYPGRGDSAGVESYLANRIEYWPEYNSQMESLNIVRESLRLNFTDPVRDLKVMVTMQNGSDVPWLQFAYASGELTLFSSAVLSGLSFPDDARPLYVKSISYEPVPEPATWLTSAALLFVLLGCKGLRNRLRRG